MISYFIKKLITRYILAFGAAGVFLFIAAVMGLSTFFHFLDGGSLTEGLVLAGITAVFVLSGVFCIRKNAARRNAADYALRHEHSEKIVGSAMGESSKSDKPLSDADKELAEKFTLFTLGKGYSEYYFRLEPSDKKPGRYSTKIGGIPYMPRDMEYPADKNGCPMRLLAQLNFDELPHLQFYPSGILQFYCAEDRFFGMNRKNPTEQSGFRVVYHDTVCSADELMAEQDMPCFDNSEGFPVKRETALKPSEVRTGTLRSGDYRFDGLLLEFAKAYRLCPKKAKYLIDVPDEYTQPIYKALADSCTGVGGFASFDCDPRKENEELRDCDTVLLKLSRSDLGDCLDGFDHCSFLISWEALRNKDFSKVIYHQGR